jgi:hypothetical protein
MLRQYIMVLLLIHRSESPRGTSMAARFILRFDDASPTMAREPWERLELECDRLGIRPIVGVIPDSRDPEQRLDPEDAAFWAHVRRWQSKGWTIALHGLHHVFHVDPPGRQGLVPFHRRGEYVGLSLEQQKAMFARAWEIFQAEGVKPTFFMAPAHSFDLTTLEALRQTTDIRWITDGLSVRPYSRYGFNWLPQQLWNFKDHLPGGCWTVCVHPNMLGADLERLLDDMRRKQSQIVAADAVGAPGAYGFVDWLFEKAFWAAKWSQRNINALRAALSPSKPQRPERAGGPGYM